MPLATFLDGEPIRGESGSVIAPTINSQITTSGQTTGLALGDAQRLRTFLNNGAFPIPLKVIQQQDVDATLGDQAVLHSVQAGLVAMLLIMAFMILYYRLPGVLASLALVVYTAVVLAIFKIGIPGSGPVTLTLAGIAAFVLSVGMAVDANILIFERTKEELRNGRSLIPAVEAGFDRAWSSIRDSNISTLITCGILYWMGNAVRFEPDQGLRADAGDRRHHQPLLRDHRDAHVPAPRHRHAARAPALALDRRQTRRARRRCRRAAWRAWRAPRMLNLVAKRNWFYLFSFLLVVPGVDLAADPAAAPARHRVHERHDVLVPLRGADHHRARSKTLVSDLGHSEARVQRTGDNQFLVQTSEIEGSATTPPVGPALPSERESDRDWR